MSAPHNPPSVMHLIDSFAVGGSEKVAVGIANGIPANRFSAHICATRQGGPLSTQIAPHVQHFVLGRKSLFDIPALQRLRRYILEHRIAILHAHSTSLFGAALISLMPPFPAVIWHDHFGRFEVEPRRIMPYKIAVSRARAVIVVSKGLAKWAHAALNLPANRINMIPNFAPEPACTTKHNPPALPGQKSTRIVCVANIRPEKGHATLIDAMRTVVSTRPETQLLLVGTPTDLPYQETLRRRVAAYNLASNITFLGRRDDVASILRECSVGVLSSYSEGLPLALLEYGAAGLPVVATYAGECEAVLEQGKAGILVSPHSASELAEALLALIGSHELQRNYGERLQQRVGLHYSQSSAIEQVCRVYDQVLSAKRK